MKTTFYNVFLTGQDIFLKMIERTIEHHHRQNGSLLKPITVYLSRLFSLHARGKASLSVQPTPPTTKKFVYMINLENKVNL